MEKDALKIIFFGDITGRQGRNAVKSYLQTIDSSLSTFVIANIENASHGFGLTKKNYLDLQQAGINCFTSGNHIWDKRDIQEYINDVLDLVRPINYPKGTPGVGSQVFNINGFKLAVLNVLGRVFMPPIDSPWQIVINELEKLKNDGVEHIFIDFHAEATAEKICFSKYLANEFNSKFINSIQDVLLEDVEDEYFVGFTNNYIKVYIKNYGQLGSGEFVKVKLLSLYKEGCLGEING